MRLECFCKEASMAGAERVREEVGGDEIRAVAVPDLRVRLLQVQHQHYLSVG